MAEKRTLTVESSYCKNWTVLDAVRELIQNATDTGTKVEFAQMGNLWEIKDYGNGISLSDFLIGRSSKQGDDEVIGQFGEGAPIGCLVLARAGRDVKLYSNGKRFAFSFEHDSQWDAQLLTITIDKMATDIGTSVRVECSAEEMEKVQSLFLKLVSQPIVARGKHTDILTSSGAIYVNGLCVSSVNSLFGYNFKGRKDLVNRDRNAIGHSEIVSAITDTLAHTTSEDVMREVLQAGCRGEPKGVIEVNQDFQSCYPYKWKAVIRNLWGDKVCLADNTAYDHLAAEDNWKVLALPWGLKYALRYILPNSTAVHNKGKKKEYVPRKKLLVEDLEVLKEGKEISGWLARETGLKVFPIRIFRDLQRLEGTRNFHTHGYFVRKSNPQGGEVELEVDMLKRKDITKLVGTTLHEYTHGTNGNADTTREFENDLTDLVATLGIKCYALAMKVEELRRCRIQS